MKHLLTLILPALVMGGAARADGPMPSWPANLGGYFEVQAGKLHGNFLECSFGSRSEVAEQRIVSKSGQDTVMKVPGRQRTDDLICLRVVAAEDGFWAWRQLVAEGRVREARQKVTVTAYDISSVPLGRWTLLNAWPVSIGVTVRDHNFVEMVVLTAEAIQRDP